MRSTTRVTGVLIVLLGAAAARADPPATQPADVPPAAGPLPWPALVKRVAPGVVTVVAYNPDLAMPSIGTGFFVAPDEVVTARHVLVGVSRAEVRAGTGQVVRVAGIVAADPAGDVVRVRLAHAVAGIAVLRVAPDLPDPGEPLLAIGSPLGLEASVSNGVVSALREIPDVGTLLQHTVPVSVGSSGGPLFNGRGEVVGVQTAILTVGQKTVSAGQGLNFAAPARRVAALVPGPLRTLADAAKDVPKDWVPPITRGIDALALYPLTRDDFKASLAFFEASTKQDPEEPDAWFRLGLCREKAGDRPGAAEAYARSIALKTTSAVAYNNLGVVYIQQGKYAEAVDVLRRGTKLKPAYAEAFATLAVAHFQLKQYPEATAAAVESLRLNPKQPEPHFTLGRAYLESGDRAKATEQYRQLLPLDKPKAEQLKEMFEKPARTTTQP